MKKYFTPALLAAALFGAEAATGAPLLQFGDFVIPIDSDPTEFTTSSYPGGESPINAFDELPGTKYLNFGEQTSGVIITPFGGASTIQSMLLTTANDAIERDPTSWKIWGTNDPIVTLDNANGPNSENWTLIGEGTVDLPTARQTAGPLLTFPNSTPYNSYRIAFPTVRNTATANSMQIADISLFPNLDGTGGNVALFPDLTAVKAILLEPIAMPDSRSPAAESVVNAIDQMVDRLDIRQSTSPATEGPANVIDGTLAKYFNGGGDQAGFIVTPGTSTLRSFQITTANDAVARDPASYELYGTNDAITSENNSHGLAENWTLISSGALALPDARDTLGAVVPVTNDASFSSYKMLFPTHKNPATDGSMQLAEAAFYSTLDGTGPNILAPGDPIIGIDATIITGAQTKYLNFGGVNSGMIVTPSEGQQTVVTSMQITTANDFPDRDPASYEIYGTNDPITTEAHGTGTAENWTLVASGALNLPAERFTESELITFANTTGYESYKIVFPTLKGTAADLAMQIQNIQLFSESSGSADFDSDGDVDGADYLAWQRGFGSTFTAADLANWKAQFGGGGSVGAVPEPASILLAAGVFVALAAAGRRSDPAC